MVLKKGIFLGTKTKDYQRNTRKKLAIHIKEKRKLNLIRRESLRRSVGNLGVKLEEKLKKKDGETLWNEIRKEIYKRDGWFCQECGIHCHNKVKIQCHHIDYNTTNKEIIG
jgi:hypothetical protein